MGLLLLFKSHLLYLISSLSAQPDPWSRTSLTPAQTQTLATSLFSPCFCVSAPPPAPARPFCTSALSELKTGRRSLPFPTVLVCAVDCCLGCSQDSPDHEIYGPETKAGSPHSPTGPKENRIRSNSEKGPWRRATLGL